MTLPLHLPLDQFRFNIVLRVLITAYGISGIGNFIAFVPGWTKEDEKTMGYSNKANYSFWLISSLLFFILGVSQFRYQFLVYITLGEIYLTIIVYLYLIIKKYCYLKANKDKDKEVKRKNEDFLTEK